MRRWLCAGSRRPCYRRSCVSATLKGGLCPIRLVLIARGSVILAVALCLLCRAARNRTGTKSILICTACWLRFISAVRRVPCLRRLTPGAVCGRCAARCRVGLVRFGIIRVAGGVLCAGRIPGARLHGLCACGRHGGAGFQVAFHSLRGGGQGLRRLRRCILSCARCAATLHAATLAGRAGRGLPHGQQLRQQGEVEQ